MMTNDSHDHESPDALRVRLADAEDMLRAIRHGEIDALVVEGDSGNQVYTLHSAEEPYRALIEQMQEGAVVLTRRGHILYSNARFAALVGEPPESVVGTRADRFVSATDRADFDALLSAGAGRCRSRLIGSGSGAFEVSLSLTTTASADGGRLNLIVTDLSDILEANRNQARAERANRTKDDFLAMLGHELRTPLSAIRNAGQVLEETHDDTSATRAREVIARQVGHITHLTNDLLDVERLVAGKIRLHRESLDMADAVRRAVAVFTEDVTLDRDIDLTTEPVSVNADAVRLEQVLTNIVNNAVKYTPAGGRIRVALRAENSEAVLTVEDTGLGISPRMLPFIFDMYVQADRTLDRAQGGLGIGLTLVRRLVELHGGTVAAESEGEGHGSRFVVRLPQTETKQAASASRRPERRMRSRRVLLIEDGADAREMLRMTLELAGHTVYGAADGIRGLELVKVTRPDVAIIDIGLPRLNGYEVAQRIRKEPHGREMLLVALTGYDAPGDALRSRAHGFDHHLVKPVDPDRLARLLSEDGDAARGIST
jgi:signal transduction histidine kinase/ActR/RegA family two-component response regulator